MERLRLVDLSFIYFIRDILHKANYNTLDEGEQANIYRIEVPDYIKVMDEYPDPFKETLILPTVAISWNLTNEQGLQIGGGFKNLRIFGINIFARRSGERDDLGTIIYEGLDTGTKVKNYNIAVPDYVYDSGSGRIMEHYSGAVPNATSDLLIDEKTIEDVPRTGRSDIDCHRALIRVHTLDLR